MDVKSIVVSCLYLCLVVFLRVGNGERAFSNYDLELERELQIINKPPIKTFTNEVGDVVDCVDILKQPAFDHPLLKNHTIQLKPSSYPEETNKTPPPRNIEYPSPKSLCPNGSVPIRRMTKEDLMRAKAFTKSYSESNIRPNTRLTPGKHVAIARSKFSSKNIYRGIEGTLNIYNPSLQTNNMVSGSHLWIERGEPNVQNSIQVGWTVNPSLYGDRKTRTFAYWRVNDRDVGCFNTLCSGFIQTSSEYHLGSPLNSSVYDDIQYETNFRIFQDKATGHWWFDAPKHNVVFGYWPKVIFTTLGNGQGAYHVTWGGMVMGQSNGPSPQMGNGYFPGQPNGPSPQTGNGYFPDGTYNHACYVRDVHIVDDDYNMIQPAPPKYQIEREVDDPDCYAASNYHYGGDWYGFSFLFGGPGGEECGP